MQQRLTTGDMLLLCTDGLYNFVPTEEMQQMLLQAEELSELVQQLLALALEKGSSDNLTVIVYRHEAAERIEA